MARTQQQVLTDLRQMDAMPWVSEILLKSAFAALGFDDWDYVLERYEAGGYRSWEILAENLLEQAYVDEQHRKLL